MNIENYKPELITTYISPNDSNGIIYTMQYRCPCGKDCIIEDYYKRYRHSNIERYEVYINCRECSNKYFISIDKNKRKWKIKNKTCLIK